MSATHRPNSVIAHQQSIRHAWLVTRWWLVAFLLVGSWAVAEDAPLVSEPSTVEEADTEQDPVKTCDDAFRQLAAESERAGCGRIAAWIEEFLIPEFSDRVLVIVPGPSFDPPDWVDGEAMADLWRKVITLRREQADRHVARARALANLSGKSGQVGEASDRVPRNDERPPSADESAAAALQLVHRTLWLDPDHELARAVAGWERHGDGWLRPEAARRLDRGEVFLAAFGWLPADRVARYEAGERYERGRWVQAREAEAADRTLQTGWRYASDHWQIVSSASLTMTASLAETLEDARTIWAQSYGSYVISASELRRRFAGRGRPAAIGPFAARLVASKEEYVAELERLEPSIARTQGIYWAPSRIAWFFDAGDGFDDWTVLHEAVHQLFAESRKTSNAVGERNGFWAVEAAACFLESAQRTRFGWMVGGRDSGRAPMARHRLLEDGFHVPLAEVVAMGRKELQTDPRLPRLYSEFSGLADFFMNGERGRLRRPFIEYLERLYAGRVDPGTLASLCRCSYDDLDERYRRHMARELPVNAAIR